jgi:3-hydroxyacyl-[acyl-carrier-protein] dehydratase
MALDGFYRIEASNRTETGWKVDLTLIAGHRIYEGHFPEKAVVPGMCTLTVIREVLSQLLGKPVMFSYIRECKFLSALLPEEDIRLSLDIQYSAEGKVKCLVSEGETSAMKLSAEIIEI